MDVLGIEQVDRVLAAVFSEVAVVAFDHCQAGAHVAGELEGGGTFGVDGIRAALANAGNPTAAATAMAIQQAVTDSWQEPLEDDGTIVVMAVD